MANRSLGLITITAGTPIALTANLSASEAANCVAHSYMVEGWGATTGDGYVGTSTLNKSTGAGCFGRIPKSTATQYFYFQATCAKANDLFQMDAIFLDGDTNGDKFLVSLIEA